jgi:lysophospholipase L1-like esterase
MVKKNRSAVNLTIVLSSVVAAVFLCEGVLRLLDFPTRLPPRTAHPANYHEVRERLEFTQEFQTNSQGLRYREIPLEKDPDQRRVFVVGDSFAEGWGVDEHERFTDLLERRFDRRGRGVLFINGGLAGGGLVQYGRLFFDRGVKYHPDGLLICIYANDVSTAPDLRWESAKARATEPPMITRVIRAAWPRLFTLAETLEARREYRRRTTTTDLVGVVTAEAVRRGIPAERISAWRDSLPANLVDAINHGKFNASILSYGLLYPNYWADSIDIFSAMAQEKWSNSKQVLTNMIEESRKIRVEPAVVFIPCYFMYDPASHEASNPWVRGGTVVKARWLEETTQIQKRLASWAGAMNVPFLDLTPTFREVARHRDDLNWKLDGHWTAAGHEVAAEAMGRWLEGGDVFSFVEESR